MSLHIGTHLAYLAMRAALFGDTSPSVGRSLYVALGLQDIAASDLDAAHVSDMSTFVGHEYDGTSYARQALTVIATAEDHVLHRWTLMAAAANFGVIRAASQAPRSVLIILSPSAAPADDGSAYLVAAIDGGDVTSPRNGDGHSRFIVRWLNGGLVLYGPNCDVPTGTTGFALSDAFSMMALHS